MLVAIHHLEGLKDQSNRINSELFFLFYVSVVFLFVSVDCRYWKQRQKKWKFDRTFSENVIEFDPSDLNNRIQWRSTKMLYFMEMNDCLLIFGYFDFISIHFVHFVWIDSGKLNKPIKNEFPTFVSWLENDSNTNHILKRWIFHGFFGFIRFIYSVDEIIRQNFK